jgi:protein-S-isoprenylcysteine O-methyltransferase Ste14
VSVAVTIASYFYLPIVRGNTIQFIGLGLILTGVLLRFLAIWSLGRAFTVNVTIREGHELNKRGMYKHMRHPSYTFALLSFIGLGLSLNNWLSLAILLISVITVFQRRIKVEEAALETAFGQAYRDYRKTTWGLIPFVG